MTRHCATCNTDFEQTFGGRPRKNCYDCVPPRLEQGKPPGGQSHDAPRTKRGNAHRSASHKRQGALSTAPDTAASSGVHCGLCGSFCPPGEGFCNPQHRSAFAERVADAKRGYPQSAASHRPGPRYAPSLRPLERVRRAKAEALDAQRAFNRQKAQEHAAKEAA